MDLNSILADLKVPLGTPDQGAVGLYEMIDQDQVEIHMPLLQKSIETVSAPPPSQWISPMGAIPTLSNSASEPQGSQQIIPSLVPPPLLMGAIPAVSKPHGSNSLSNSNSKTSNVIIAEPKMRDLQKDLVSMIPSSVRRKGQPLNPPLKRAKESKEEEYSKFMAQFD